MRGLFLGALTAVGRVRSAAAASVATTVAITGSSSVTENLTTQLTATVYDQFGTVMVGQTVVWSSNDTVHATVSSSGLVTGKLAGSAVITAACGQVSATLSMTVNSAASAALTKGTATATPGDGQVSLSATVPTGGTQPYTYQWYSSSAGVKGAPVAGATSRTFTVTGLTNGTPYSYIVTASDSASASVDYDEVSATPSTAPDANALVTKVHITRPDYTQANKDRAISTGDSFQYTVALLDANNQAVSGATATWASSDETIATVDQAGLAMATSKAGYALITATCNGIQEVRKLMLLSGVYGNDPTVVAPSGISAPTSINNAQLIEWTSGPADRNQGVRAYYSATPGVTTASPWQWLARRTGGSRPQGSFTTGLIVGLVYGQTYYYRLSTTNDDFATESDLTAEQSFAVQADPGVVQPLWSADFETVDDQAQNGCRFINGIALVDDATRNLANSAVGFSADIAFSGTQSLRIVQPARDLCSDSTAEMDFHLGADLPELWVKYMLYLPDGTEGLGARYYHRRPFCAANGDPNGTVSNNKFLALWCMDYNGHEPAVVFETRTTLDLGGVDGDSYLYALRGGEEEVMGQYGAAQLNPALTDAQRGRWSEVMVHVRTESAPGASDGIVEVSIDGAGFDNTGLTHFAALSEWGNRAIRNGYILGWSDSGFNEMTNFYIDNFQVYAHDPTL